MRAQSFLNTPIEPVSGDTGTNSPTDTSDEPPRPDTDTVPKKKAE